jgi:hypothetical protein
MTHNRRDGQRRLRRGLAVFCALGFPLATTVAQAQDQDVVFVHGLTQSGAFLSNFGALMQSQLQLQARTPTLGWQKSYSDQAAALHAALAGASAAAAVSHSNGGVVVREYVRQYGANASINRHVTVGTPHRGATLAYATLNGAISTYGNELFSAIATTINFYAIEDPDWPFLLVTPFVTKPAGALAWLFQRFGLLVGAHGYIPPSISPVPVLPQLVPGSSALTTLNASSNLAAEASRVTPRVSISTAADFRRLPFALFTSDWTAWENTRRGLMFWSLVMYAHYADHPDPWLASNAGRWSNLFLWLYDLPAAWQLFIGALVDYDRFNIVLKGNDGMLTWETTDYPNATRTTRLLTEHIAHPEQMSRLTVFSEVRRTLVDDFGIPFRGSGSATPLATQITGPTAIQPLATCSWVANPAGGTPPYTYLWVRNGNPVGTESVYTAGMEGLSSFTLLLEVRDSGTGFAWKQISISNTGTGECFIAGG